MAGTLVKFGKFHTKYLRGHFGWFNIQFNFNAIYSRNMSLYHDYYPLAPSFGAIPDIYVSCFKNMIYNGQVYPDFQFQL
jgi:hypothetical protein